MVPLNTPVKAANGETIDHVAIAADTTIIIPIRAINRSEQIWGADAKEFKPERWLNNEAGLTAKSKEISGFHHLLSFIDGPRICLGRLFSVAEFKVSPAYHRHAQITDIICMILLVGRSVSSNSQLCF